MGLITIPFRTFKVKTLQYRTWLLFKSIPTFMHKLHSYYIETLPQFN
jgi:hypothetical protein